MKIKKEYKMYCGHRNQDLRDKCFRPHGHDYKIFVTFNVERKGSISTLFDDFDKVIEPLLKDNYDHRFLIDKNDPLLKYFKMYEKEEGMDLGLKILDYPTSVENVCYDLFKEITKAGFDISHIDLQETRTSTVTYTKEDYEKDCYYFHNK